MHPLRLHSIFIEDNVFVVSGPEPVTVWQDEVEALWTITCMEVALGDQLWVLLGREHLDIALASQGKMGFIHGRALYIIPRQWLDHLLHKLQLWRLLCWPLEEGGISIWRSTYDEFGVEGDAADPHIVRLLSGDDLHCFEVNDAEGAIPMTA